MHTEPPRNSFVFSVPLPLAFLLAAAAAPAGLYTLLLGPDDLGDGGRNSLSDTQRIVMAIAWCVWAAAAAFAIYSGQTSRVSQNGLGRTTLGALLGVVAAVVWALTVFG